MNYGVFHAINLLAGKIPALDGIMIFFAQDVLFIFPVLLLVLCLRGRQRTALYALFAACLALFFGQIIHLVYYHPRPFTEHAVTQLIPHAPDASFPSDHALVTFAVAFAVSFRKKGWGYILMILSILVGVARVYTGVHYPADIAGGALAGYLAAVLVHRAERPLEPVTSRLLQMYSRIFPFLPSAKREDPAKATYHP